MLLQSAQFSRQYLGVQVLSNRHRCLFDCKSLRMRGIGGGEQPLGRTAPNRSNRLGTSIPSGLTPAYVIVPMAYFHFIFWGPNFHVLRPNFHHLRTPTSAAGSLRSNADGRYFPIQRSTQSFTVLYQSCEFCGFSTQWPSSGKYNISDGIPSICSVVNRSNACDTSSL
jgi:hypothetical protein